MKTWLNNMRTRRVEVVMLHISLGYHVWLPMDFWYVVTGRVAGCTSK
jgi:hypothetical protein